ncbi:ricin-type beta-trefoil lectin domain protein [Streptomyces sp. A1547]|uniref:ricin-type beta-trefoil lectin domain protein n=1 Tax=Streptomyces sp. A1547 TaxID=2563105 RepID=UPI001F0D4131|nr:ricin-type beta-trefoil lectin domain protein [Streptomyces sp. A1547]
MLLVASLLPTQAWAAPPGNRSGVQLPDLQPDLKAKLDKVAAAKLEGWDGTAAASPPGYEPSQQALPRTDTSVSVPLTPGIADKPVQASGLPISLDKVQAQPSSPPPATPSGTWTVEVKNGAAQALGINGTLIKVTPPAEGSAPADLVLDYAKFKDLYGAEWATRLQLKMYPVCVLDVPRPDDCDIATDVPTSNDPVTQTVRATVDPTVIPAQGMRTMALSSGSSEAKVLATTAGAKGVSGTYAATPLSPSGFWTAGGSGGGFSWTYPLTVPAPPAGPSPKIAFSYSSQAVDGKTSATNSQASWIGDGWDYNPGFVERRYRSCADDRKANPAGANNNNDTDKKKGDLCWAGDNMVMSLGGSTTELVHDDATGQWIPASDDGSKVERKTGGNNGALGGEYWVVTARDGTRYHFGRQNVGAHGDTGQTTTESVFTVPVFGNHAGEPCYSAKFSDSGCTQAWRWNLDYVEDVHGNAMVIDWAKEGNRYARNQAYEEKDPAKVGYVRGGYPVRILYGLRGANLAGAPAGRVDFGVDERCVADEAKDITCKDDQFESKDSTKQQNWWDTPTTLNCKMDAKSCDVGSPTFWTRKRLTSVTTLGQRTEGSAALSNVDKWSLIQSFPKQRTDTHPPLWLESITRTGYGPKDGRTGKSLPAVSFIANAVDMPNRVAKSSVATPGFDRLRVETIRTETGGETKVEYSAPCPVDGPPAPDSDPAKNTSRCFPAHWSADPDVENPPLEWFNKYVVNKVTEKDRVGRQPDVTTSYEYRGGGAWAKEDDEFTRPEMRTYNQWRGYAEVVTTRGAQSDPGGPEATEKSQSLTRYFRGMSGDAGRAEITVKDSTGTRDFGKDLPQYQGQAFETITYEKASATVVDGTVASRALTEPWSQKTATRKRTGTTDLEAYRSGTARTDTIETISTGATRTNRTFYEHENVYGLVKTAQTEAVEPDGNTVGQTCTATYYVHNPASNLIGLPSDLKTTAGDCAHKDTGALISASRTSYDALDAFGTAPTKGLVRQVETNDAAGTSWITTARTDYDALGRSIKVLDAAGNPLTTAYTPDTGTAFSVTSTNALGHTTTTKIEPGRGTPLETTDANGRKVTTEYDELGRSTAVWTPSQKPGTDKAAFTFSYQIKEDQPPIVSSGTLQDDGTYTKTNTIYDGLLRPRQTQGEALGGGRLITDTLYNANGTVRKTDNGYHADGTPDGKLFVPESMTGVPNSTQIAYDGLGRPLRSTTLHQGVAQSSSTTQYGGDWTLTRSAMDAAGKVPLSGSRTGRTWTDALGRTKTVEYATSTDIGSTTWNKTEYGYDNRNKLTSVKDAVGNQWTYGYDARGRMTSSTDPDTGSSTFGFDKLDQQIWAKDSSGRAQYTVYDALGRATELHDDAANGPLVATWSFDTLTGAKGKPVASVRYVDGVPFKSEVTGYDTEYRPTGSRITIPDTSTATGPTKDITKGFAGTYAYSTTYTPTGKVQSTTLPATPGGLAAEKLISRYDRDGMPQSLSGLNWYTAETIYSPFGQLLQTATGSAPNRVWTTNRYNPSTGQLTQSTSDRETGGPNRISDVSYTYDVAGNITAVADTRGNGTTDRECYAYNPMGQLTNAWTGKTCAGPTLADVAAGPDGDGFWQEYGFDSIGNRTKLIDHDLSNKDYDDETTYKYERPQPHALTKVEKTTRKPGGSTVNSLSTYDYDASGNTTKRTIGGDTQVLSWDRRNKLTSASSPGIGAVAVTGLSGKCLDVENGNPADGTPVQLMSCKEAKAQQWRLTEGTLRALGKCLTAEGSKVVLRACDSANEYQKFTSRPDKSLYNTKTGNCLDVPGLNDADGTDLITYTCSTNNAPNQQWNFPDTATKYVYDADGNRLIEENGTSRTLYLGEAEITVNKAGQAMDAVRYYSSPGAPTTVRRTNGKTAGHSLSSLFADQHNTATTSVDMAAGQAVTRRKSDPYGNPRGAEPGNWPGNRTFLGTGIDDTNTSLTHIGAREYESTTGRFISVDPIIDITDPMQMNGYTYASGNPVMRSDPTGLKDDNCAHYSNCTANGGTIDESDHEVLKQLGASPPTSSSSSSSNKTKSCGFFSKCNWNKTAKNTKKFWNENKVMIVSVTTEIVVGTACLAAAGAAGVATGGIGFAAAAGCGALAGAAGAAVANAMNPNADHSTLGVLGDMANGALWGAAGGAAGAAAGPALAALGKAIGKGVGAAISKIGGKVGSCPIGNSFASGTLVLMADGSSKPIEELEPGDKVLATDPETGETVTKDVTATILGDGSKNLVEITVATNGDTDVITATDKHPFWAVDLAEWVDATELQPGQWLQTSTGTHVQITAVNRHTVHATVHNLTVADLHTYYVLAGTTPVLVHNCGGGTTVYRGVPEGHPGFDAAVDGSVVPRGGTASAEAHQLGNTESPYTSWSTSEATARRAATRGETGVGVVLESRIPAGRPHVHVNDEPWADPDLRGEFEVLIEGPMQGNPFPVWRPR